MEVSQPQREDAAASTLFGRLMLSGYVSYAEYTAGERYAQIVAQFRRAWDIPDHNPKAINLFGISGRTNSDFTPEAVKAIKDKYDRAFESLHECGNAVLRAVNAYAIYDRRLPHPHLIYLKIGLKKLVEHFGLDPNMQITLQRRK
jgi:hypothetical protein